jgi:hypothetical protein
MPPDQTRERPPPTSGRQPRGLLAGGRRWARSLRPGRETWWLLLVVIGYVVAQRLLFHMHRYLAYDEAVYLSQVYPGVTPDGFAPLRARGVPWLISPVSLFGPPVFAIRYYLLFVSGVLAFAAFHAWVPVLRMRAVAAAVLFCTGWPALHFGTEINPNLPVAFGGIAAAGYLAQHLSGGVDEPQRRRALVKAAAAVAFVAVIRPSDAVWLAVGLLAVAVTRNLRVLLTRWAVLVAGLAVGWVPWVVEAYISYGGFLTRLRESSAASRSGFHPVTALHQLAETDGPLVGTQTSAPLLGYLWWGLLAIGIVFAIGRAIIYRDRTAAVAASAGVALAVPYLLFTTFVDARYMLPAYGLLTVCLCAALPSPPAAIAPRAAAWTAIGVSFAVFAVWNVHTARFIEYQQYVRRQSALAFGKILRELSTGGRCFFASQYGAPEVAFASRCTGAGFSATQPVIWLSRDPGTSPVYVLTETSPAITAIRPVHGTVRKLEGPGVSGWWLFVAPRADVRVTGQAPAAVPGGRA